MAGHWLKFERAREHIEALEDAAEAWLDTDAYTIVRDVDPQSGLTVRRAKITESPPYSLGLIAGDAIHNLRAALDHVVYAISESALGAAFTPKDRRWVGVSDMWQCQS